MRMSPRLVALDYSFSSLQLTLLAGGSGCAMPSGDAHGPASGEFTSVVASGMTGMAMANMDAAEMLASDSESAARIAEGSIRRLVQG